MEKVKCILCGKEHTDRWVKMYVIFVRGKITRRNIECCKNCFDISEELLKHAEAVAITTWLLASKVDLDKLPVG